MVTNNYNQLITDIKNCTICADDLPLGANPVFQIDPQANILIAGQAPGIRVHNSNIPFNDPSGDRLRNWLGIDKAVFYDPKKLAILPMGFCYPGTGKSGDLPPRKECAQHWRQKLLNHLPNIKLTLAIGQYAIKWHLQDKAAKSLTDTVQNWQQYWPDILPLPHPSPRNNIWLKKNPWFEKEIIPTLQDQIKTLLNAENHHYSAPGLS